jgi:hypothetical protein
MSSFVDESTSGGRQEGRGITFKDEKHTTKRVRANGSSSDENMDELDMDNLDGGETENESNSSHTHKRSRWRPPDIEELFVAFGVPRGSVASYQLTPSQLSFPVNAFEDGEEATSNSNSNSNDGKFNRDKPHANLIRSNNMLLVNAESRTSIAKSTYRYFEKYLSQPAMNTDTSDDGVVNVKASSAPGEDPDAMELDQEHVRPIHNHKNTSRRGIDSVRVYNTTGNNDNNPDTCVTEPSQDIIIRCVAAVIEAEIRGDESELNFLRNKELFPIFDLESDVSRDFAEKLKLADKNKDIMYAYIYYYLDWTSRKFCYSAEVNIIALAYVSRLTSASELTLTTCNWQNIWVTTVNLAMKMWQDVGLKSAMVAQALRGLNKDHVRILFYVLPFFSCS